MSSGEWSGAPPSLHYWVCIFLSILMKLKYTPKLKEIENTLQIWSKQILTPISQITIIKSLIISKLKHLFLTISSPKENIINQLVSKIYSFIWDNKPDKIKRQVLSQNCDMGGLKMLNIKMYIKGLKLSWIRRIIKKNLKITKLLLSSEKIDITQLLNSGHTKTTKNPFWEEVFNASRLLQLKLQINQLNINVCNICNNENIKVGYQTVFYKDWAKRAV